MIVETEELETIHKNIKNRIFIIHILIYLIHQNNNSSESNHAKVIELPKTKFTWFRCGDDSEFLKLRSWN